MPLISDPDRLATLSEAVLRVALKLSFGGMGTAGNYLGQFDESLVLSGMVSIEGLDAEMLAKRIFSFAEAAVAVKDAIVNELQDLSESEPASASAVTPLELSV